MINILGESAADQQTVNDNPILDSATVQLHLTETVSTRVIETEVNEDDLIALFLLCSTQPIDTTLGLGSMKLGLILIFIAFQLSTSANMNLKVTFCQFESDNQQPLSIQSRHFSNSMLSTTNTQRYDDLI